jgi:VIT1/CCC1 family predicted Fe2+/Mn2+ transporter
VFLGEALMVTILLVILILMLLGAIPAWPHSRSWGYAPSGSLGLIVIIILLLALTGRL